MRHGIKGRKLNRTSAHRRALFANQASSLILNEQIKTTVQKAKELRPIVEKLITLAKKGDLHSRRQAFSFLYDKQSVEKLFSAFSDRYKDRNGGYLRIVKAGFRYGDCADVAYIEFVDRNIEEKGKYNISIPSTDEDVA